MTVTDDLRARLKEDQEIISRATDGPWEADLGRPGETRGIWPTKPGATQIIGEFTAADGFDSWDWSPGADEDLTMIAASRTRWEQANQALLKVLELHKQVVQGVYSDGSVAYECDHCPDKWPCPTVRTLTDNLTGEEK